MKVLLLGGTTEARQLAAALVTDGDQVTTSLAGRVSRPRLPEGDVRVGGFGGVEGLRAAAETFDVVVDATHPFAATISAHAAEACAAMPLLLLQRPGWTPTSADDWTWVGDHAEAAATAARHARPFLTVGRQPLPDFVEPLARHPVLARVVEDVVVPRPWTVVHSRGPYALPDEIELMTRHGVDVLVTKDSGGEYTRAKLDAAAALRVHVAVVRRPTAPDGVPVVGTVDAARRWVRAAAAV